MGDNWHNDLHLFITTMTFHLSLIIKGYFLGQHTAVIFATFVATMLHPLTSMQHEIYSPHHGELWRPGSF